MEGTPVLVGVLNVVDTKYLKLFEKDKNQHQNIATFIERMFSSANQSDAITVKVISSLNVTFWKLIVPKVPKKVLLLL